mmetsp:Transcript_24570/g.36057  ORF Transcript_24570/g.36057 Transcript_24570/m.36057 type:complete len:125 (+) Transcript_24570:1045-1419(+)
MEETTRIHSDETTYSDSGESNNDSDLFIRSNEKDCEGSCVCVSEGEDRSTDTVEQRSVCDPFAAGVTCALNSADVENRQEDEENAGFHCVVTVEIGNHKADQEFTVDESGMKMNSQQGISEEPG